jgi:chaperonin GroEL (HSP60 family)
MVADSQRAAAEMEVKKLELQIRLREMDAKERMELTKLSGKIVQDHQQRVHDQAEGAIDRLHEHHQNELDRAHASDEGEKNRKAASERPPANA